jgi:hypothetical protein
MVAALAMLPPFDIMRVHKNDEPVVIEAAQSLEAAMVRANALRENDPGDYIVISRTTGMKILFSASGGIRRI